MFNKYRRFLAFIIDMFIVSSLAILLSSNYHYNPELYEMDEAYKEFEAIRPTLETFEFDDKVDEFFKDGSKKIYAVVKSQVYIYGWYIIFYFFYFVIFAYFTGGQTLGKKITKLKIVKKDGSPVGIKNLLLRSLTNGSSYFLGTNIFIILSIIGVVAFNGQIAYIWYCIICYLIGFTIEAINIVMYIFGKDNMCLNDKISGSKVIVLR